MEIKNVYLELQNNDTSVKGFKIQYLKETIAGRFRFKPHANRRRHCVLLASRFNKHSREEHGPFPGWFIQLVGNRISVGVGNGKTWLSVQSKQDIRNGEFNSVLFSLNNETKKVVLGVNDQFTIKENISFRCPVRFLTIGALNMKGEFRFSGILSGIEIGTLMGKKKNVNEQKLIDETKRNMDKEVKQSHTLINNIKNNISNLDNDIQSLREIKAKIASWVLRGLQLDTSLLDNQITKFEAEKQVILEDLAYATEELDVFDHKIKQTEEVVRKDKKDLFEFYKTTMTCLHQDVKTLDSAVHELSQFKELGIGLGTAFDSIEKQRENICDKMDDTLQTLKGYETRTMKMMNVIKIEDI